MYCCTAPFRELQSEGYAGREVPRQTKRYPTYPVAFIRIPTYPVAVIIILKKEETKRTNTQQQKNNNNNKRREIGRAVV